MLHALFGVVTRLIKRYNSGKGAQRLDGQLWLGHEPQDACEFLGHS